MTYLRTGLTVTATLALSVSNLSPAFAQGGPGATGTLKFSQGFSFSDNEDLDSSTSGTTFQTVTGLGFMFQSVTRTETLNFGIGTQIIGEYGGGARDEFEVENSNVSFDYTRQGANAALTFSASYNEYDLDESVITLGPAFGIGAGSSTLILDDGTAEVSTASVGLQTGINGPFGLDITGRYFQERFNNTVDPDLTDRDVVSVDALAQFRLNPTRALRLLAGVSVEDDTANPDDITDTYVGVGLSDTTGGGLSYSGDVIYDRSETSGVTTDGIGVALSVSQDRPNGTLGIDLSSRVDDDGRRTAANFNRSMTLPAGSLAFSLGVVDQEGDTSIRPQGSISYQRDTRTGSLTASLAQNPSVDSGTFYSNTTISVGYSQSIDATSGWAADIDFTSVNELGGPDDDERATARVTYSRAITPEWQMNTGVEHIRESDSGGPTESSNTVFFNIQRDITFGF